MNIGRTTIVKPEHATLGIVERNNTALYFNTAMPHVIPISIAISLQPYTEETHEVLTASLKLHNFDNIFHM